jgi:hypothetical protein
VTGIRDRHHGIDRRRGIGDVIKVNGASTTQTNVRRTARQSVVRLPA